MREFSKVHVIALPRCATVSMCDGLGALGISLAHLGKIHGEQTPEHHNTSRLVRMHEQISKGDYNLDILRECDGLADYPACIAEVFEALDSQFPGSLFINVRRDKDPQAWLQSAERQFVGLRLIKTGDGSTDQDHAFAEAIADFRRMTFGQSEFDPHVFLRAYERHQREVERYFASREDVLLDVPDIGLLHEFGFDLLCEFLGCQPAAIRFPCKNEHSAAPKQAFLSALSTGKVVSRTGIEPAEPDRSVTSPPH